MPHERAFSRHARDRDLPPEGPRLGPYEHRYDVRRGYEQPLAGARAAADDGGVVMLFLGREDDPQD